MAAGIIAFDYIAAYTVIGFASLFGGKPSDTRKAVIIGIVVTFFLRFLCHFITGMWIWDALWPNELGMSSAVYSAAYNGGYLLAELILCIVLSFALSKALNRIPTGRK